MRKTIVPVAVASFAAAISFAERIAVPPLAPSSFADAEASTNAAISAWAGSRTLTIDLTLDATASNGVEVAIGSDSAPPDGALSPSESALRVGWDSGVWFAEVPSMTNRFEATSFNQAVGKSLRLQLSVRPDGTAREFTILDGGAAVLQDADATTLPPVSNWNMVRVTTRGRDAVHEGVVVRSFPDKTQVFVR